MKIIKSKYRAMLTDGYIEVSNKADAFVISNDVYKIDVAEDIDDGGNLILEERLDKKETMP
jgi:hypothetical protein